MRLKLDENLGRAVVHLFAEAGHDVTTVSTQRLNGALDTDLIEICRSEGRCLVSLDLYFSNPIRFRPSNYAGIPVFRLPRKPAHSDLIDAIAL
jgi:predicted nuclease of predicted toxin-antitoxin system